MGVEVDEAETRAESSILGVLCAFVIPLCGGVAVGRAGQPQYTEASRFMLDGVI